jgi:hypothetical protein
MTPALHVWMGKVGNLGWWSAPALIGIVALVSCGRAPVQSARVPDAPFLQCPAGSDQDEDEDGLSDDCELAYATTFAPVLRTAQGGCNWDAQNEQLGGGYYFAVLPGDSQKVRVLYLPAYYRDCGWSGFKCFLYLTSCAPHSGDSELIAIELSVVDVQRPKVEAVFLSAHCFGRSDADCRWYRGEELRRFEWREHAPVVWVAEGKQANYPSAAACDAGHWFYDTCDRNSRTYRFPIVRHALNIGSRAKPLNGSGCVDARHPAWRSTLTSPDVTECFWTPDRRFTGWQSPAYGSATAYEHYLALLSM